MKPHAGKTMCMWVNAAGWPIKSCSLPLLSASAPRPGFGVLGFLGESCLYCWGGSIWAQYVRFREFTLVGTPRQAPRAQTRCGLRHTCVRACTALLHIHLFVAGHATACATAAAGRQPGFLDSQASANEPAWSRITRLTHAHASHVVITPP